jgi:hypothetical protein
LGGLQLKCEISIQAYLTVHSEIFDLGKVFPKFFLKSVGEKLDCITLIRSELIPMPVLAIALPPRAC